MYIVHPNVLLASFSSFRALLFGMLLVASVTLILAGANVVSWLDWVQYLSYIKLGITVIKYIPQAYMNYR